MEKREDELLLLQCEVERAAFVDALAFVDRELAGFNTGANATADADSPLPSLNLFDDVTMVPHDHSHHSYHDHDHHEHDDDDLQLFGFESDSHESVGLLALEALTAADVAAGLSSGGDSDAISVLQFASAMCSPLSPGSEQSAQADASSSQLTQQQRAASAPKRRVRQKKAASTGATPSATTTDASLADTHSKPSKASSGSATRSTKKPLNYNPNKARDERREELIYLRKKVVELETQLSGIQQKRPRLTATAATGSFSVSLSSGSASPMTSVYFSSSSSDTRASDTSGASDTKPDQLVPTSTSSSSDPTLEQQQLMLTGMWQDIATRQCEGRIKAERENIRLKIVLENQLKIAKSLEKLLKKKMAAREVEHCSQCQQLHHVYPPTRDPRTDAQIFDDLTVGVEQSYKEVDDVFAANGLAQIEVPHSDAGIRSESSSGHGGMFLEILANKVLPFDVHSTATAAWHYFVYAKQRTPYRSYFFDSPKSADTTDDTITENFSLGLHANSTSAHFRVKQILRRYVEEHRVVIVWRSFVEPVEFSDEPLSDLRFQERGYIVIKKPRTLAAAASCALVQTCYIFTPNFTGDVKSGDHHHHPKVGAITDFVLSATAANISASHQMIENVLIEQAMRKGGNGGGGAMGLAPTEVHAM